MRCTRTNTQYQIHPEDDLEKEMPTAVQAVQRKTRDGGTHCVGVQDACDKKVHVPPSCDIPPLEHITRQRL